MSALLRDRLVQLPPKSVTVFDVETKIFFKLRQEHNRLDRFEPRPAQLVNQFPLPGDVLLTLPDMALGLGQVLFDDLSVHVRLAGEPMRMSGALTQVRSGDAIRHPPSPLSQRRKLGEPHGDAH